MLENLSYAGATPANFSTDLDGSAVYSIDIQVPPGTGQMQPQLSLCYNSAAGNGMLGMGWSLNGLSAITRSPMTLAQDGFRGAVTYTAADRFTLDGQRLMVVNAVDYASSAAVYHTEIETWVKVVPVYGSGVAGRNGPDSFRVWTKDGKIFEYGNTPDSAVPASSTNPSIRVWALNRVTDLNGNSLTVTYLLDSAGNANYPIRIDYTENAAGNLQSGRSVQFAYETRTDVLSRYTAGFPIAISSRMTQIATYVGSQLVRTYSISYAYGQSTGRSCISNIVEADSGAIALPATEFQQQDGNAGIFQASQSLEPGAVWQGSFFAADFDGDGRTDLVNTYESNGNLAFTLFQSDGSGFSSAINLPATSIPYAEQMQIIPMDVNGDGCIDFVCAMENNGDLGLTVLFSQPDGQGSWKLVPGPINGAGPTGISWGGHLIAMDVDGDGLTDLVYAWQNGQNLGLTILFSNSSSFAPSNTDKTNPTVPFYSGAQYLAMEFNGDNLTDLVYIWQNGDFISSTLFLSAGREGLVQQSTDPLPANSVPSQGALISIDVNCDGLGDIVQCYLDASQSPPSTSPQLVLQTITCSGSAFQSPATQRFTIPGLGTSSPLLMSSDVNGDGLPDLLIAIQNGNSVSIEVLIGTPSGFVLQSSVTQPSSAIPWGSTLLAIDFAGSAKTGLVYAFETTGGNSTTSVVTVATMSASGPFPDLTTQIADGLGGTTVISYAPLTDNSVYQRRSNNPALQLEVVSLLNNRVPVAAYALQSGSLSGALAPSATYATRLVQFPKYVVAAYSKNDGRDNTYQYSYFYQAALLDLTGRGWLGFESTTVTDHDFQTASTAISNQVFPLTHTPKTHTVVRSSDQSVMRQVTYGWQVVSDNPNSGAGVQSVLPASVETAYYTAGTSNSTPDCVETKTYAYDAFCQPSGVSETGSALGAPLYTFSTYINDPIAWHIGFLSEHVQTADSLATKLLTRLQFSYDDRMNIISSSLWDDQANCMQQTTITYDVFGNCASVQDAAQGITTTSYDSQFQAFPVTRVSPPNTAGQTLTWQFAYDPRFGILSTTTDPNGIVESQTVDGLGRVIATGGPDPTGKTTTLTQTIVDADETGNYVEKRSLVDWSGTEYWTRNYLDGLGRVYRTVSLGADGITPVLIDRTLNSRGQPLASSLPYYSGAAPLLSKNLYDSYGRCVQSDTPQGEGFIRTGYRFPTVNDKVRTDAEDQPDERITRMSYRSFNSKRLLVQQTDALNGVTVWNYDGLGRLLQAVDPAGISTNVAYDSLGRRVSVGVEYNGVVRFGNSFQYDSTNRAVVQQDGAGTTVTQQYDALGRLVQRTVAPSTGTLSATAFVMDDPSVSFGQGRVCSVSTTSGINYNYAWDVCGNQVQTTSHLGDETYQFIKAYGPDRRVTSIQFPDGSQQIDLYNAGRQLTAVQYQTAAGLDTVASYGQFTAFGLPESVSFGNGTTMKCEYDNTGCLQSQELDGSEATQLAACRYNWDNFQCVTRVDDSINSAQSQTFAYDPVGRLKSASVNGSSFEYAYDIAGNLISNSGTEYTCDWHQVTEGVANEETVFSGSYDARGNLVSATRGGVQTSYEYDGDNQLISSGSINFGYDHTGRRITKCAANGVKLLYPAPYYEIAVGADGSRQHSVLIGSRASTIACNTSVDSGSPVNGPGIPASGMYYSYLDHLNSTIVESDGSGKVVTAITYQPYGQFQVTGSDQAPRKFTGKSFDADLGLYYFGARYYDPVLCRFITADDRPGARLTCRDALHRYAYCLNDPINRFDADGHDSDDPVSSFFDYTFTGFFRSSVKHFFTDSIPAFFENQTAATVISYVVDGGLIIGGGALALFGGAVPVVGPLLTVLGSTLLGAGISGLSYNISTSVQGNKFQWGAWGIQLGIGAAVGVISGGIATLAGVAVDALANSGRAAFAAGNAGRILMNVGAGIVGNAGAGAFGQFLNNVDPYQGHHAPSYGIGGAALFGAVLGGIAGGLSEGVAAKLSRTALINQANGQEIELNDFAHGPADFARPARTLEDRTVLDATFRNNFWLNLPGAFFSAGNTMTWNFGWHPIW